MELESENEGWRIPIKEDSNTELGRGTGFATEDRTISRRHISFQLQRDPKENDPHRENLVFFEVIGKNPIWIFSGSGRDKRVFQNSEKGELRVGDRLSLSLKKPVFFTLKSSGSEGEEEEEEKKVLKAVDRIKKRTLERKEEERKRVSLKEEGFEGADGDGDEGIADFGFGSLDFLHIDPVQEFGFLLVGQEFNQYPKPKILNIKDWDWFIEELNENSEDDEIVDEERSKGRKRGRRKKKKGEGDNDEDWTGECEDEKVLIAKVRSTKRPKYSKTRSKDKQKPDEYTVVRKKSMAQEANSVDMDVDGEEDEDDESLGGFIVTDDVLEEAATARDDDIEEEEFQDDDDDGDEDE